RCRLAAADARSVTARAHRLAERLGVARRIVSAHEARHESDRRCAEARAALERALDETGFPDAAAAAAARLPAAQMEELERTVAEHRSAAARVREALADPAISSLTGEEVPAVAEAAAGHAERHAALMTATEEAGRARDAVARLRRCR